MLYRTASSTPLINPKSELFLMKPLIFSIGDKHPQIDETAFIAPGVVICGDVIIGPHASVWYGCVLRGDSNQIKIGKGSNVQDGTIIHVDSPQMGGRPTIIGENALIGHRCLLHGCTVEDEAFIGMASTMLDHSTVKTGGFLAAGAFLGSGKTVPAGEMWAGLPAKKMRDLKPGEDRYALIGATHYVDEAMQHRKALDKLNH